MNPELMFLGPDGCAWEIRITLRSPGGEQGVFGSAHIVRNGQEMCRLASTHPLESEAALEANLADKARRWIAEWQHRNPDAIEGAGS
jgi:hypothetical protein